MEIPAFFASVEATLVAQFNESAIVGHSGDRGEDRERILREFLAKHLPRRYGVVKGQVIDKRGTLSHAADVIIYDAIDCPILYSGNTAIVPLEGVYGVIEVKSRLSKAELLGAMKQIESFKKMAPGDASVIQTREYVTMHRPSRPFGAVFAYSLADNSLASLSGNFVEKHRRVHNVNFFTNIVAVLGSGLLYYEKLDWGAGERTPVLDTDEFVNLVLLAEKRARNGEAVPDVAMKVLQDQSGDRTFGRFFVLLLISLARLKLSVPDLGRYLDPNLPMQIIRES